MHFHLGVLLPAELAGGQESVELAIDALMEPYWQDMEVDPYMTRCYCVGQTAEEEVDRQVESEFGPIASLRKRFETESAFACYRTEEAASGAEADRAWERFIRFDERRTRRKALLEAHPGKDAPSPLDDGSPCDNCGMTGEDESTANPDMKWDWWKIGGRWAGWLSGEYDPDGDPRNYEACAECGGTGIECEACGGTGRSRRYGNAPFDGDIVPLGGVAERVKGNPPHALLTAAGVWHPLGDLCCMGSYSGQYGKDMARSEWKDMVAEIVDRHLDQVIVCVDCHVY